MKKLTKKELVKVKGGGSNSTKVDERLKFLLPK